MKRPEIIIVLIIVILESLLNARPADCTALPPKKVPPEKEHHALEAVCVSANMITAAFNTIFTIEKTSNPLVGTVGVWAGTWSLYLSDYDNVPNPSVLKFTGIVSIVFGVIGTVNSIMSNEPKNTVGLQNVAIRPLAHSSAGMMTVGLELKVTF